MHGRVKVRTSEEQRLLKEKEQQKKLAAYKMGMKHIASTRNKTTYDPESFSICTQILNLNPHIYTLWNYRKEVILIEKEKCKESGESKKFVNLLDNELTFTEQSIFSSPKNYSSWHHRYWVLEQHPEPNWEKEFQLCTKYLTTDDRNFHCWDYRRLILKKTSICLEKELQFSTERLNVNFSNYSSWHYRSTLRKLDPESLENELNLVQSAVFTDPYDTSAWFYFRWVLQHEEVLQEKKKEILESLKELEELEPDCKWIPMAKCWLTEKNKDGNISQENYYKKLIELDPMRKGQYEYFIQNLNNPSHV